MFKGFGEVSLDFRVLFWTAFDYGLSTNSRVGVAIDKAFKEADITIPFPQRDLHFIKANDEKGEPTSDLDNLEDERVLHTLYSIVVDGYIIDKVEFEEKLGSSKVLINISEKTK